MDEDFFKREADQKWRERADERLLSLTTDATVANDRLDDIDDELDSVKKQVYGNPDTDREGLIKEVHNLQREVSKLSAVIFQDSTGKRGMVHDVDVLMGRRDEKNETRKLKWTFWTAVIVALISSASLLVTNWDKLEKFVRHAKPAAETKKHHKSEE